MLTKINANDMSLSELIFNENLDVKVKRRLAALLMSESFSLGKASFIRLIAGCVKSNDRIADDYLKSIMETYDDPNKKCEVIFSDLLLGPFYIEPKRTHQDQSKSGKLLEDVEGYVWLKPNNSLIATSQKSMQEIPDTKSGNLASTNRSKLEIKWNGFTVTLAGSIVSLDLMSKSIVEQYASAVATDIDKYKLTAQGGTNFILNMKG